MMTSFKPKTPLKPDSFSILLPGTTPETALLSEQLLTKNNKEFHIFFNERKFHNHLIHHLLAAYSFGASKDKIQEIFDLHAKDQRPLPPSIETITRENFKTHLGKAEAYTSYLHFFESEIEKNGSLDTIRRFVWSGDLLARTVGGLYHPMIHIGYGLEFDIPGTVAEGLSMAACTEPHFAKIVPSHPDIKSNKPLPPTDSSSSSSSDRSVFSQLYDQLASRLYLSDNSNDSTNHQDPPQPTETDIPEFLKPNQILKILQDIRQDATFDVITYDDPDKFDTFIGNPSLLDRIHQHASHWTIEESNIQAKLQELYTAVAILLGASGVKEGYPLRLDFSFMHALTSVEFVHQYAFRVAPSEAVALMKAHVAITLVYFVIKGRPTFNYQGLLQYTASSEPNPWLDVFDRSLRCKEAHVIKVVRSCSVGQIIYGPSSNNQELNKVWLNVAQMVCDGDGNWDFDSLGFDESWKK